MSENDLIQILPPHKWGGCIAVVSEPKSFGCQAYVSIPTNDGNAPRQAYIRLKHEEYVPLGAKALLVPTREDASDAR